MMERPNENAIQTRVALIQREPSGLIRGTYTGHGETVEDARANMDAVHQLSPTPAVLLIDSRALTAMTAAVRAYYTSDATAARIKALGILIASPTSRFFGNIFLGFQVRRVPTKLFTDEVTALRWLYTFLDLSSTVTRRP